MEDLKTAERTRGALARALKNLPAGAKAKLAGGPPVVIDGQTLDRDIQVMLAMQEKLGEAPMESLPVDQARTYYEREFCAIAPPCERVYHVEELTLPGPAGKVPARLYSPPPADEGLPMLVHYHGGGHVVGSPDTCDYASRLAVHGAGAAVLAVDYRMGPENPMPASAEDCEAAFRFAVESADRFGVDPERIAVGGDSAGGNLGAVVSQAMKAAGGPMPAFQWLIYPSTALGTRTRSYELFKDGFLLTADLMDWFQSNFLCGGDGSDVRCAPMNADDLSGLPPAYVATGGFDPLRDEGEQYALRLREAGVPVALQRFPSLPHGFANLTGISPAAHDAMQQAVGALRMGLAPRNS
ncbi:MAG TPA: alpha/beta hydrolase [Thermoleophilaceae bacterium]|nr:alpha/beta hydrolase [Thermoleophilaceae bacterium]